MFHTGQLQLTGKLEAAGKIFLPPFFCAKGPGGCAGCVARNMIERTELQRGIKLVL